MSYMSLNLCQASENLTNVVSTMYFVNNLCRHQTHCMICVPQ